jgi:hypothetical protein
MKTIALIVLAAFAANAQLSGPTSKPEIYYTPEQTCRTGFVKTDWHDLGFPYYIQCVPSLNETAQVASEATKVTGALLPDPKLTPCAVQIDKCVNRSLHATLPADPQDKHNLCSKSFTTRDYRHTSAATKRAVCAEYGVTNCPHQNTMELDHVIALEDGGADVQANLWVQMAPQYHFKDKLETVLHVLVCSGKISLSEAQKEISTDWVASYKKRIGPLPSK